MCLFLFFAATAMTPQSLLFHYQPQTGTSCTAVSIFYAYAVLARAIHPICCETVMKEIMHAAWHVWRQISDAVANTFLQQDEVFNFLRRPSNISVCEMYLVFNSDVAKEFDQCIHFDSITSFVCENRAMVMTAGEHTLALVSKDAILYFFDPLGAVVREVQGRDDLLKILRQSHGDFEVMTLSLLTVQC